MKINKHAAIQIAMSLMAFAMMASMVAVLAQQIMGMPPVMTGWAMVSLWLGKAYRDMKQFDAGLIGGSGVYRNDIQKEIWSQYIVGAFFKNNEFLNYCFKADQHVLQGKVVHIPQAGGASTVVKNRSSLPGSVTKRTDLDITYALDEFTTDARVIPHADTVELSYDAMASVMAEDMDTLRQTVADNILIQWCPDAGRIIRTTGDAVNSHLEGTTGTRKKFLLTDLLAAQTRMNKDNVPMEGRYALMSASMYAQFVEALTESQYRDFSRALDEKTGVVGKLYGFNIMMRSTVATYTNDEEPEVKAYGAEVDEEDNDAVLCWHVNSVERAMGEVVAFHDNQNPLYYGDLMSFLMRMGGRIRRKDSKGVIAIVQAHGA